jgi:hypothetical protein
VDANHLPVSGARGPSAFAGLKRREIISITWRRCGPMKAAVFSRRIKRNSKDKPARPKLSVRLGLFRASVTSTDAT